MALAIALAGATASAPTRAHGDDVQVVRAWFDDAHKVDAVAPLLGHAQVDRAKGLLRTEADPWLRAQLIAAGFRVELDRAASDTLQRTAAAFSAATSGARAIPGFACYRTVEEAQDRLDDLASTHPQLLQMVDIGPSWQWQQGSGGYRLRVARATNSAIPGPKPALFVIGSIHAREYTPAELLLRFVEDLVEGYGSDADATWILDHHEVHVLVHANPDGRKRAEAGALWRKNTNSAYCATASQQGIDLNRNFPFAWNSAPGGSSGVPCQDTYRGPSGGSEPETEAIAAYATQLFGDHRGPLLTDPAPDDTPGIFMDIHSYSQLVLWPWGFTEDPAPNGTALAVLGRRLAAFNGYTAQAAIGLYATDGTTDDYTYGELGVASYAFELGTDFFQDCQTFENAIEPTNRAALRYAARVLRAPYVLPAGPDTTQVRAEPDLILAGDAATVVAQLDDARQQTGTPPFSGPVPAVQPIASAAAYLTPPWLPGATAQPLQAADGSFDTPVEAATGAIDSGALAPGRHLVYVQARDSSGADGPVGAAFVEVVAPEDAASIAGTVTDIVSGAPLVARVEIGPWQTTTAADGGYARVLRAGSWPMQVSAPGFETALEPALAVAAGDALTRDVALYRTCAVLDDPVEPAAVSPFTPQAPWQKRAGAGQDGGAAWLQSASGDYANNLDIALASATLDLSGYSSVSLRFDQRCNTEADWDYGIVEVSGNGGGSWSEVFRCDGETQWRTVELPLPQLDGAANARVRFRFTSDTAVRAPGWAVDNVVLSAGGAECRAGQQPPVSIDAFDATPAQIVAGDIATLAWTTRHATACSIANSSDASVHTIAAPDLASGTFAVSPAQDVIYTLSCDGADGPVTAETLVIVTSPPPVAILEFVAMPPTVAQGEGSTLAWTTENATACSIVADDGGAPYVVASEDLAEGSLLVEPEVDVAYTLSCDGEGGPVTALAAVTVMPPLPPAVFDDGFETAP
ncbi:M14 family zinc carboxypeptidase [Chiayiivirga flava]|uniref:Peptidase M14 domain-containing protein n=1 Tax=Chiayiivirga flava TaxID=659595 RepID=A0A7W8D6Q9_9GAMM|nr:hypothetical protein [Chiayiivirga flava]